MAARLKFEQHLYAGRIVAKLGNERAVLVYHVCNGKLIYGFDCEVAPAALEDRLARTNEKKLARLAGVV